VNFFVFHCRVLVVADITDVVCYACFPPTSFNLCRIVLLFCGFFSPKIASAIFAPLEVFFKFF